MTRKEYRKLKVYETSGKNYKIIPQIRIQGDWLKDFDFDIGTYINVECRDGVILITKADELMEKDIK